MKLAIGLLFSLSCVSNLFANSETVALEQAEAKQPAAAESAPAPEDSKESAPASGNLQISCTQKNAERRIEVVYKVNGAKVPCDVVYKREDGDSKVIYSANAKAGFCEEKAEEHKNKLVSLNWVCKTL